MKASEEFFVVKGKRAVVEHNDGFRFVIELSPLDGGEMTLYDIAYEELDVEWVRKQCLEGVWDAAFPALAEAFRFLSPEEER